MRDPGSFHNAPAPEHDFDVERYYRFHAPLYDFTRWSFLFGRVSLLDMIPDLPSQPHILEIGCGTGKNIEQLEYHYPDAHITGLDLSPEMLKKAGQRFQYSSRVDLKLDRYSGHCFERGSFDLIVLSYALTMFDRQVETALIHILEDLKPTGYVAVVDFNKSPFNWFRRWMEINHVNIGGHLLPLLQKYFCPVDSSVQKAYLGMWTYFRFVGKQW